MRIGSYIIIARSGRSVHPRPFGSGRAVRASCGARQLESDLGRGLVEVAGEGAAWLEASREGVTPATASCGGAACGVAELLVDVPPHRGSRCHQPRCIKYEAYGGCAGPRARVGSPAAREDPAAGGARPRRINPRCQGRSRDAPWWPGGAGRRCAPSGAAERAPRVASRAGAGCSCWPFARECGP